jgi:acetyltransferase-like isoleucine patch superfamily enzyme
VLDAQRAAKSLHNRLAAAGARLRGIVLERTRASTLTVGSNLAVGRNVEVEIYGQLILGDNVTLSSGCFLSVGPKGRLEIGDKVFIGRGTVVVAAGSIRIGAGADIAEHCTIRDSDHALEIADRHAGEAVITPVTLGRGCWIGAGARILRGTDLGEGVVVGANAVVRGTFPSHVVVAGVPARTIKTLRSSAAP